MNGPANSRGIRTNVHYAWECESHNPWPKRILAFVFGLVIGAACGTLIGGVI